jgi:hypothetical protein
MGVVLTQVRCKSVGDTSGGGSILPTEIEERLTVLPGWQDGYQPATLCFAGGQAPSGGLFVVFFAQSWVRVPGGAGAGGLPVSHPYQLQVARHAEQRRAPAPTAPGPSRPAPAPRRPSPRAPVQRGHSGIASSRAPKARGPAQRAARRWVGRIGPVRSRGMVDRSARSVRARSVPGPFRKPPIRNSK